MSTTLKFEDTYKDFTIIAMWYTELGGHWCGYFGKNGFIIDPETITLHGGCDVFNKNPNFNKKFLMYGFDCVHNNDSNIGPNGEFGVSLSYDTKSMEWTKEKVMDHLRQVIDEIVTIKM